VPGDQVQEKDLVFLDNQLVVGSSKRIYIMYNKPKGITCTTDPKITGNIVDAVNHPQRVFMVGRLDKYSTGLIFLTNDGDIVNKILRAQFGHETESFVNKMSRGVHIGDCTTRPCKVKKISGNTFSVILTEGKNRQIRRMCEELGVVVKNLHRIRIMNIIIGALKSGEWKDIPTQQFDELQKSIETANNGDGVDISELIE
jgi:23S rRNA pseudouridine2604 synthase